MARRKTQNNRISARGKKSSFAATFCFVILVAVGVSGGVFGYIKHNEVVIDFERKIVELQTQNLEILKKLTEYAKNLEKARIMQENVVDTPSQYYGQNYQDLNDTQEAINDWVLTRSADQAIQPKITQTIIQIESGGNKYAIGIVSPNAGEIAKVINRDKVDVRLNGSNLLALFPKDRASAEELFDALNENKAAWGIKAIDYGLMQINDKTIDGYGLVPKDIYLNPFYNIAVGIDVLRGCYNYFGKNQFDMIECYNKGMNKDRLQSYDYYDRFIAEFRRS